MMRKHLAFFVWSFVGLFLSVGCTRSIEMAYQADMAHLPTAMTLEKVTLGVGKFDDKRAWVNKEDPKSSSYVALQGTWKFAMTYQEKDYIPVNDLVQNLFVAEFAKAGINVKAVDQVLSKHHKQQFGNLGEQKKVDYLLGGEILVFEFVNEPGFWTVTSRRTATFSLALIRVKDEGILIDTVFNETDREGEGLGVMHSTNIDKLMNKVFKKVVHEVIQQVADKIGIDAKRVSIRLNYEGGVYEFAPSEG